MRHEKDSGPVARLDAIFTLPITAFADVDDVEDAMLPDVVVPPETEDGASLGTAAPEPGEQATAELEPDARFQQLFEFWMTDGYPDDVGGVYWDDNTAKHVIELLVLDEARIEEIRSMLSDPESVEFGLATYSYNELQAIQEEIAANDLNGETVYGVGIGWTTIDGELTGFGPGGKENRVVVSVHPGVVDEYAAKYHELYGDKVYVENSGPIVPQDDATELQEIITLI